MRIGDLEGARAGELLLRRESFGGLLFAPRGAVQIEVDGEAFAFLRDYFATGRAAQTDAERGLLQELRAELPAWEDSTVRCVDDFPPVGVFPFPVYNAPTLADVQITERCPSRCPHCYVSAGPAGAEMSLGAMERACQELSANGVGQVALGGGEPLSHPHLPEILRLCRDHHLVPNLTTSGLLLSRAALAVLARHCGAVALSLEGVGEAFEQRRQMRFALFCERLTWLLDAGIPTVLQVTLSQESFADLDQILAFCLTHPRLYGVIFLAYKEVGRGAGYHHTLFGLDPDLVSERLQRACYLLSTQTRVGYDCCLAPALTGFASSLDFAQGDQLEGCSALRGSIGISINLDVTPCTFTPDRVIGNLHRESLREIWRKPEAQAFRFELQHHSEIDETCRLCPSKSSCLGGCPAYDLVRCTSTAEVAKPE